MIDECQQGPIMTINEWPWVPTMTNSHRAIGTSFDKQQQVPMTLNKWPITSPMIPQAAPILHPCSLPCRPPLAYPISADTTEYPSKCVCQPKCEGEPNTNPSLNVSTPPCPCPWCKAQHKHQQFVIHGEPRTQQPGEGMQLGQGSVESPSLDQQGVIEGERWCLLLFPFYLYIVGISSHKNILLVDKKCTLYCPLPE